MNPDQEGEIRARLRDVALPAAPEGLVERMRLVASRPSTRTSAGSGPRGRLLIPLAAVLVIAAAAVWAGGGRPPSRDSNAGSQGPSVATSNETTPPPGTTSPRPIDSPLFTCAEPERPVMTCDQALAAALAALGPNHPPIAAIRTMNLCLLPSKPICSGPSLAEVTFVSTQALTVWVYFQQGPGGSTAEVGGFDPRSTPEPSDDDVPREPPQQSFGPGYAAEPPAAGGPWIWRAELSPDRRTLSIEFFGDLFYSLLDRCSSDYQPWVGLDGSDLVVKVGQVAGPTHPAGPPPSPPPSGERVCRSTGYRHLYHLALPAPFTGTTVRDLNGGVLVLE